MRLNFQENKPKTIVKYVEKKDYTIIYTIGGIIFIGLAFLIGFNVYKGSKCSNIEDKVLEYASDYAEGNNLLNLNEGDSVTVDLEEVYNNGYPTLSNGNTCTGTVKFTLADGKIIKTFDIKYDASTNSIDMLSYFDYTSVGGELTAGDGETRTAVSSSAFLTLDGVPVQATCYNIDGNNYFKNLLPI